MSWGRAGEPKLVAFPTTPRPPSRRQEPVVSGETPADGAASAEAREPGATSGRDRERALVDAWREAHWTLRMKLQELSRHLAGFGVERLYDDARRCDNLLNEFYQARADVLARQLRDLRHADPPAPRDGPATSIPITDATPRLTIGERALLARVRELGDDDRAVLLRLAAQMARNPRASRR